MAGDWPDAAAAVGPGNLKTNTLPREATTSANVNGAQVLMPRWDRITPLVKQIFGN